MSGLVQGASAAPSATQVRFRLNEAAWFALFSAALVVAIYFGALERFQLYMVAMVCIFAIATTGLTLLMGFSGQLSLAQGAFFGFGAYTAAQMTKGGIDFSLALLGAVAVTAILAALVGAVALRLRGFYLAVTTLALGLISAQVFKNWNAYTGGVSGLGRIPEPTLAGISIGSPAAYAAFCLVMLTGVVWVAHLICRSDAGRALRAISNNELAALSIGIPTSRLKLVIFTFSAMLAGLAGGMYAHLARFVTPDHFGLVVSIEMLVMAIVGGLGHVTGGVVGSALLLLLSEELRAVPQWQPVAFGALLVVFSVLLPRGLCGLIEAVADRLRRIARRREGTL